MPSDRWHEIKPDSSIGVACLRTHTTYQYIAPDNDAVCQKPLGRNNPTRVSYATVVSSGNSKLSRQIEQPELSTPGLECLLILGPLFSQPDILP